MSATKATQISKNIKSFSHGNVNNNTVALRLLELKNKNMQKANVDQWIIHGLWPNYKNQRHDRDFPEYCSGRNANFNSPYGELKLGLL